MNVLAFSDKVIQLQQEIICWQNNVSDLLNSIFSPNLIDQAEEFQNRFLKADISISQLRTAAAKVDNLLLKQLLESGTVDTGILNIFESLRLKMKEGDQDFNKLKTSFFSYLERIA